MLNGFKRKKISYIIGCYKELLFGIVVWFMCLLYGENERYFKKKYCMLENIGCSDFFNI